jgi:hypothetical protein
MGSLRLHRPLMVTAALMLVLGLVSVGGLIADDRVLLGAPIWLKPAKFTISLAVYAVTLAWLISLIRPARRLAWWLGTVIAVAATLEIAAIMAQAARGRTSHFNVGTALDAALFSLMGATIVALWLATAGVAVLSLRQRMSDRATSLAIRLGLVIALGGLSVGFLMTSPTPEQRAAMTRAAPTVIGAHSVGVPDGGAGLPVVGWSTEGGDLRAGHFVGMHALQALPLFAFGLLGGARRVRRLASPRVRARLVVVAAAGYAGLTILITWQALRGQALIHPDPVTLAAAGGLIAATAVGAGWALRRPAAEPVSVPTRTEALAR